LNVQRNLTNFIVYQKQKHKRNASDKVPHALAENEIDETKYHQIPKIMKKDPSRALIANYSQASLQTSGSQASL
jgi:hypothetical protein